MLCRACFSLAVVCLAFCPLPAVGQTGSIVGRVVDRADASVGGSKVRVIDQSNAGRRGETTADDSGQFRLAEVEPGVYTVKITAPGFREKTLPDIRVTARQDSDLGALPLDVLPCDAPGVSCDIVLPADPVHKEGAIDIPLRCTVDIDEGKSNCPVKPPGKDTESDFWIGAGSKEEIYLTPLNGAKVAMNPPAKWGKDECTSATYSTNEVRIDVLSGKSRVCIRTNRERYSRIVLDGVKPGAATIRVTFTTWEGIPEMPSLDNAGHR